MSRSLASATIMLPTKPGKLVMTTVSILVLGLIMAFVIYNYPLWQAQNVAKQYVLNWNSGQTLDRFTVNLKLISNDSFIKNHLDSEIGGYKTRLDLKTHDTNSDLKTFVIDKHPNAVETVTYYTENNPDKNYSTPMQSNLILFKENGSWKIQSSYILRRSDKPIPTGSKAEENIQSQRYQIMSELMERFIVDLNTKKDTAYKPYFSSSADIAKYSEQITSLPYENLKVSGIYNLSSSDYEIYTMVVVAAEKDKKQVNLIINLKLVTTKDGLKVETISFSN